MSLEGMATGLQIIREISGALDGAASKVDAWGVAVQRARDAANLIESTDKEISELSDHTATWIAKLGEAARLVQQTGAAEAQASGYNPKGGYAADRAYVEGGGYRNRVEPNRSQDQPPALFGGLPGTSNPTDPASVWNAGAAGAVKPALYIPPDFSEAARQRREQRSGGWNQKAADEVLAALRQLKARLEAAFGGPTYIGQLIDIQIANLEAKVLSPDEALSVLRYIIGTLSAGLQQEALSQVATTRNLAQDLLRFAGGAALPGGPGSLTPGPRPAPTPTTGAAATPRTTTAGIGAPSPAGAGLGATSSQVAAVGAAVGHVAAGVSAISATVNATATAVSSQVSANQQLAADFRATRGWQQRIETGLIRPMREEVQEIRRSTSLGASATRDLSQALERFTFSGALASVGSQ